MSQFVNYNKRSIQLPPGCKDLSDIFKPASLRKVSGAIASPQAPRVLRADHLTEKLGSIGRYVAEFFDSGAESCMLNFVSSDESVTLDVSRTMGSITSHAIFLHDETREIVMRAFFDRQNLEAPIFHENPVEFPVDLPGLPVWCIFPLTPVPLEASVFSKVASALFRDCCGMNDPSELRISILEAETGK